MFILREDPYTFDQTHLLHTLRALFFQVAGKL